MQCDRSLPNCCSAGYCGRKDCSGCYRTFPQDWLVVTPRQFVDHFTVGSNFTCGLLTPPVATPVVSDFSGNPSCAAYDGVALRVPRVSPASASVPTALCVELSQGRKQATAAWNFPSGAAGNLSLRLALEEASGDNGADFGGAAIALSDHYAPPWTSRLAPSVSLFVLPISNGTAELGSSGVSLPRGRWFVMTLSWSMVRGTMEWEVAGLSGARGSAPLLRGASSTDATGAAGTHEGAVSYWSLQSFGAGGGLCVASLAAEAARRV